MRTPPPRGPFEPMWVAVDVAVFTVQRARLELLLIQMKRPPFQGRWALPGGRIAQGESVEDAATRELAEKTGLIGELAPASEEGGRRLRRGPPPVCDVYLEQLYTFSDPDRDPAARVLSVAHLALIPPVADLRCSEKYSGIQWFAADSPPPLAFDHLRMATYAVRRLRAKLAWTNVAYSLLPETFTLGELQRVYEAILGRRLDPRNFRKRIVSVGLVEETGEVQKGEAHRPGRLFRFTVRRPIEIDVLT